MDIIDISSYQGIINWDIIKPQVDFVIMRASVGLNRDKLYQTNSSECEHYHIPFHAYHYIKALSLDEARTEAKVFADATSGTDPLFYIIDAEYKEIPKQLAKAIIEEFELEVRRQISNNIRVALYIGHNKYKLWSLDYSRYSYIWIPRYGVNDGTLSGSIEPKYKCDLWQYTSKGKIDGINHTVDLNTINGDKPLSFFITGELDFDTTIIMKKGDKNKEVKRMQSILIALGYDLGEYGADGSFGKKTMKAIKKFQLDYGFQKTGEVTDVLYDTMFAALVAMANANCGIAQ